MVIEGFYLSFLRKNICCGYSLGLPVSDSNDLH